MEKSTIAIIIMAITILLFMTEMIPLAVTAMGASLAMAITGCIKYGDAVSGFSAPVTHMIAGMLVVGDAVFETGLAKRVGDWLQSSVFARNEKALLIAVTFLCLLMSAFLSNSATIATFIPIVAVIAASSHGKIQGKTIVIVAGMAAAFGGGATLVGSTAQLVGQAIMVKSGVKPMEIFTLTKLMLPLCIVFLIYAWLAYPWIKRVLSDMEETIPASQQEEVVNIVEWKVWLSGITIVLCIAGFVLEVWNVAIIALTAATILIATNCIGYKKAMRNLDWNTLMIIGASQGFALGLDTSGAGKIIATTLINWCGGPAASAMVLLGVIVLIANVLTNFMSNTALAAMLIPIVIPMARELGVSAETFCIGVIIASNTSISTPIATPAVTQTLVCGYRYNDYVKIGGPINIIIAILTIIGLPIVYGL